MVDKTLHRKLKFEQHNKRGEIKVSSSCFTSGACHVTNPVISHA
jgi:hypothetical protein